MGKGDHDGARDELGDDLQKVLDAGKLKDAWRSSAGEMGAYQGIQTVTARARKNKEQIVVRVALARGTMDVLVGFDTGDRPSALFLKKATAHYRFPDYVEAAQVVEREVLVGDGDAAVSGSLVLPRTSTAPVPAVIFVHGSGPQDRDTTMGAARPFRDIALGLATRGVASLRWDKRTSDPGALAALGVAIADITVEEEYFVDVASALRLVASTQEVDPQKIFVLGHSQGGWLAPWLLERHPTLAGAVVLAGNARHFNAIVPAQIEYISKLDDGVVGPLERLQLDEIKQQCARAQDKALAADTPATSLPLGVPAKYWIAIRDYDAMATAKKIDRPFLVLQGGRDYQVTPADDYPKWQGIVARSPASKAKLYPALNHAFVPGEGRIEPKEYLSLEGSVPREVVEDIAGWIDERTRKR